jgi:hypothetical protein
MRSRAASSVGTSFCAPATRMTLAAPQAGIFQALLDDGERGFQEQVLSGRPPLGPGAAPLERLIAYGRARVGFMMKLHDIARCALDGRRPGPAQTPLSQLHIRMLLEEMPLGPVDLDILAVQLTAALDGPLLFHLPAADLGDAVPQVERRLAQSWQDLVQRVCRP